MFHANLQSFPHTLSIIFLLSLLGLRLVKCRDLQVIIQNSPSFIGDSCQITFSLISPKLQKFTNNNYQSISITILESNYSVRFSQIYQAPYIHNYNGIITTDVYRCQNRKINSSYYCFRIQSSIYEHSTQITYNKTHSMYKFTINNLICPNSTISSDGQSHVKLKIEINSSSNQMRQKICWYTFSKLYKKIFFYLYPIGIFTITICLYIYVNQIGYFCKWVYLVFVISDIFIQILFIYLILLVPEQKIIIPQNKIVFYVLINILILKNFIINIIIGTNYASSMIKQKKLMKNKSIIKFALAMSFNYKLYFVVIYRFEPFSSFRLSRFTINHLETKYYKFLFLEIICIFLQIYFLSTIWFYWILKIVYFLWLGFCIVILAIVSKSIRKMLGRQQQLRQMYKRRSCSYSIYEQKQLQLQSQKKTRETNKPNTQAQANICIDGIILQTQYQIKVKNNGINNQQIGEIPEYIQSQRAVSYSLKQDLDY